MYMFSGIYLGSFCGLNTFNIFLMLKRWLETR